MGNTILTAAEKSNLGFMTTGLGLMVTFIVLTLIIVIIVLLSKILMEKTKNAGGAKTNPAPAAQNVPPTPAQQPDDTELIAVLTAAVAAQMGRGSNTSGLVIRSYRQVERKNAWAEAGKNAQIFNKF